MIPNDGIPLSSSLRFGDELAEACGGDEASVRVKQCLRSGGEG